MSSRSGDAEGVVTKDGKTSKAEQLSKRRGMVWKCLWKKGQASSAHFP